ncbi:MAG: hypothetical protein KF817_07055 [Phycisphaeraceae bacterium]|nr:hypothetical protein [Phycisphaeraceae bacterium]
MRIDLRDDARRRIGRVRVNAAERPVRVHLDAGGREVFLNWDSAVDDAGRLRRCIACSCPDLFREKAFPAVTALVVVLAFLGAAAGLLGLVQSARGLLGLLAILMLDVAIFVFSRNRLVCYRCLTAYRDVQIAKYVRGWDRAIADRHAPRPAPASPETTGRIA